MTNSEVVTKIKDRILCERKITNEILELINIAEYRKIHLELGYSSLFDWLVKGLGYSESAASRRISAARMLKTLPQVSEKLETGELNLTTISKAQRAIRTHQKKTGNKLSKEQKAEVVRSVENKSSKDTDLLLFQMFPETASPVHQERTVLLDGMFTRLSFNFNQEQMADLEWAKAFFSHSNPDGELSQIFARLLKELRQKEEKKVSKPTSAAGVKRISLHRVERKCEYKDPKTGKVCGATYQVQSDHIQPKALGGSDHLHNRRCLCRAHNLLMAEKKIPWANHWRT